MGNSDFQLEALPAAAQTPVNAMTVDVEEYFQVSAFESHVDPRRWAYMPSRVEASMDRILALFELADVKATFFTLGCIAQAHPQMIRRMVAAGHEIASHGMRHVRVINQDWRAFHADVSQSRDVLEQISGTAVLGYRAASYSIDSRNLWAHDVLAETGFTYSSSIYPGRHDAYGMPEAPRFAFRSKPGGILEIPVTTVTVGHRRLPCAGGGFFRAYPYAMTKWALRRVNRRDQRAALFYFHPWEIDPNQPRVPGLKTKTRFRHYLNLARVETRLRRLLEDFRWQRMDRVFPVAQRSVPLERLKSEADIAAERYAHDG